MRNLSLARTRYWLHTNIDEIKFQRNKMQWIMLIKRNVQFTFLCNPEKESVDVYLGKRLKSTATKKVIAGFNNLGEEIFKK